jgi:hypothetical protein
MPEEIKLRSDRNSTSNFVPSGAAGSATYLGLEKMEMVRRSSPMTAAP